MSSKILWIDNDPAYIDPYVKGLESIGHKVMVATTVIGAESALKADVYDLVILDVMIPTKSDAEEELYRPRETDFGHRTGLVFYRRNKERLARNKTQTLILTVRLDKTILDEFLEEGLPRECFATKLNLRDIQAFLDRVTMLEANRLVD